MTSSRWRDSDRPAVRLTPRSPAERDQDMTRKEKPSTHDEADSATSGKPASQPSRSLPGESLELNLSEGQRQTVLEYAELPAHLSERLAGEGAAARATPFTLDELDELLDHVEVAVHRAK